MGGAISYYKKYQGGEHKQDLLHQLNTARVNNQQQQQEASIRLPSLCRENVRAWSKHRTGVRPERKHLWNGEKYLQEKWQNNRSK